MKNKLKLIALLIVALFLLAAAEKHCETKNKYYYERQK
ncbi:hypothetical protein elemo19C_phanotate46 [Flavobacterium phage vB_FspP_elemoA_1-9C]|jgi:hypothetical protein|uniref:Uncharacterized protein n=4 Tax=Elemovirus TaxID=2948694 RepID=A0A7D7FB70_9CAUD|nr:hypothetical protein KNV10_gp65 [Flavobacterium phage vB_FspP_elemoA_7-9A]YP_010108951.1 hypothetical protein KNV11_gp62 [Flavobacterium phage vB_FspP_elemoF_6-3D]YP_010109039.1 hypothetical protein KNV12_gp62 [Flavobacterium phage vB_FspP_elemoE_6-9C]YP_010356484.1 hypothetical protein M1M21_gp64 [Flavobacterium phage vB_FspP_elemoC_14-1A]QMP84665.1 hypothetical protein elemo131A_phanotate46 [Flavobacterium phage vB_FspP_elemoA_13-1A]QMP85028.1 hypothetical protein elemo159B_phanotate45 [F